MNTEQNTPAPAGPYTADDLQQLVEDITLFTEKGWAVAWDENNMPKHGYKAAAQTIANRLNESVAPLHARIAELELHLEVHKTAHREIAERIEPTLKRIAELEAALAFYADPEHWRQKVSPVSYWCECESDRGRNAHAALQAKGGQNA